MPGKGLTYGQFVGAHMDCPQADFRDCILGGQFTELHDVVAPKLAWLPRDIAAQLKRDFWKRHNSTEDWQGKHAAQSWLQVQVDEFHGERLDIAFDEYAIRSKAARWAQLCGKMQCLEVMQDFARSVGIDPPVVGGEVTRASAADRLRDEQWWRRRIRRTYTAKAESKMREATFVHKRRQLYASDRCVQVVGERRRRNKETLQGLVAVSSEGEQLELWDVREKSTANPVLRRNELMERISGFEELAEQHKHRCRFFTLTAPSAYHRMLENGSKNPKWEGFTPRQAQHWLNSMWVKARSKINKKSIMVYGVRVAEPHHDGTPHWHMMLFGTRFDLKLTAQVLKGYWFSDYRHELQSPKSRRARMHVKAVWPKLKADGTYTTAAGYLAKYIAKNIDGFKVGEDYESGSGQDARNSCDRVAAWASAHRIRQFQQLGGPCVSLWRELRRLRTPVDGNLPIEAARKQASDESSYAGFVNAIGGIAAGRKGSIQLSKERTGELNQYGELRGAEVVGIRSACGVVRTREKVWRIERKSAAGSSSDKSRASYAVPVVAVSPPAGKQHRSHAGGGCSVPVEYADGLKSRAPLSNGAAHGATPCVGTKSAIKVVGDDTQEPSAAGRAGSAPLSSLGPVSITVRGTESRNRGEGNAWPPWTQ